METSPIFPIFLLLPLIVPLKLLCKFIESAIRYGCSPVYLLILLIEMSVLFQLTHLFKKLYLLKKRPLPILHLYADIKLAF